MLFLEKYVEVDSGFSGMCSGRRNYWLAKMWSNTGFKVFDPDVSFSADVTVDSKTSNELAVHSKDQKPIEITKFEGCGGGHASLEKEYDKNQRDKFGSYREEAINIDANNTIHISRNYALSPQQVTSKDIANEIRNAITRVFADGKMTETEIKQLEKVRLLVAGAIANGGGIDSVESKAIHDVTKQIAPQAKVKFIFK